MHTTRLASLASLVLLAGTSVSLGAGNDAAMPVLNLRTGIAEPAKLPDARALDQFESGRRYVLVLDGPMTPARERDLVGAGVRLEGYLPDDAFIAEVSASSPAKLARVAFVRRVVPYQDSWRVDPALLQAAQPAWRDPARAELALNKQRVLSIWLFERASLAPTLASLAKLPGIRVIDQERVGTGWMAYAIVPQTQVGALATLPDVQFVEETPEFTPRSNAIVRWVVQSNMPNETPFYDRGLTGAGEIIGLIDGRPAIQHCSFNDPAHPIGATHRKILAYNETLFGNDPHGTHVAATALGDAGDDGDARGVAYGARMVYNFYPVAATQPDVSARFTLHYNQGARIHTNSWGNENTSAYDGTCRAVDALSFTNDDQLMLFAVSDGPVIRNPENAKNILAVSAAGLAPNQETYCDGGDGPTMDGRRKPEIMAPGCNINSAAGGNECALQVNSGTSMACPAVAGAATLLRQYFRQGFYPSGQADAADARTPSGSLLKAMLINSAVDMTEIASFPNATEGWGRVLADNAAYFAGDARRLVIRDVRNAAPGALVTSGHAEMFVYVASATEPLKATLAFADAPAAINATLAPVNNLNLVLIDPAGSTYLGNVFSGGVSATGGSPDAINNLEQVLVPNPTPGRWRVRVLAPSVNVGPQGFASVVTGDVRDVPCFADLDDGSASGTPDGGVDINDLIYFLGAFENGTLGVDLDDGTQTGAPDGGVDINDLIYFLVRFEAGC